VVRYSLPVLDRLRGELDATFNSPFHPLTQQAFPPFNPTTRQPQTQKMTTSPTSFDYAFQPKTATDLVSIKGDAKQVLHAVSDAATVEEAMSLMQTHRLRALPVFRIAMTKDPANAANRVRYHQFISMLTLLDILTFATLRPLFVDSEPKDYTEDPERIAAVRQRRKAFLQLSKGTDLLYRPISDVLDIATTEQSIREFNAGDSLLTLLQVLTYDTHHALVKERDDPTSPVAMVTQSDALKMLIDSADSEIRKFQSSITCEQVMSRKPGTTTNDAGTTDAPLYMQNERSAFSCYKAMFRGKVWAKEFGGLTKLGGFFGHRDCSASPQAHCQPVSFRLARITPDGRFRRFDFASG